LEGVVGAEQREQEVGGLLDGSGVAGVVQVDRFAFLGDPVDLGGADDHVPAGFRGGLELP
jgi:hypothetical protein